MCAPASRSGFWPVKLFAPVYLSVFQYTASYDFRVQKNNTSPGIAKVVEPRVLGNGAAMLLVLVAGRAQSIERHGDRSAPVNSEVSRFVSAEICCRSLAD